MKTFIRTLAFTFISIRACLYVINSLVWNPNDFKSYVLLVLSLTLLYLFLKPLLKIFSLPYKGVLYVFISTVMTFIILYVMTLFMKSFIIIPALLEGLNIFGFMLPSKQLSSFWSGVVSAFVISLVYEFLDGLCDNRKR